MKQYQPLYLKYRPQSLAELIGQKAVSKTLANAIKFERVVHAYLFCGPRGTGKTSTARILAKSLNCEKGITETPCNTCVSCTSIMQGNSLDVIEIDAASHRKVEDAEDLINRVNLGTYGSRYKVYIIDEVHMLTDHAFNALLKTLEEPPSNVIFILATTEEHKVIPTIISRCQKLDFKPVIEKDLNKRIEYIAKEEKINIVDSVVSFITKRSGGCLRDAVSFLDQVSVLQENDKSIDPNEVYELFGVVDRGCLLDLLESALMFDKKSAILKAEELVKSGKDIGELYKSLVELVIDVAKAKTDSAYKADLSAELKKDLSFLDSIEIKHILKVVDKLQEGQAKLRYSLSQELQFLTEILGMLDEDFLVSFVDLKNKIDKLESGNVGLVNKRSESNEIPKRKKDVALAMQSSTANGSSTPEPISQPNPEVDTGVDNNSDSDNGLSKDVSVPVSKEAPLDVTWGQIVNLIQSNPTKTLLIQSGGHLLTLNEECVEVGIAKDMFLPRLKSDKKKREMILQAVKEATGLEPKDLRYQVVQGAVVNIPKLTPSKSALPPPEAPEQQPTVSESSSNKSIATKSEDALSGAIKDLLGAKELD